MARSDQTSPSQPNEPVSETQIQLSEMPQTDDQSQVELVITNSKSQISHTPISKVQVFAIVSLIVRVVTWLCLLISLIVLASNTTSIRMNVFIEDKIGFNNMYAYRYMMSTIVIGFVYTCVHLPIEIYQLATGKSLTKEKWLPKIIFYGDKFLLALLATGVGAAFGATVDFKKKLDQLDDLPFDNLSELFDDPLISQYLSKLDNFFNLAYVSAGFLLIAFLGSVASSILSSLALQRN